VTKKFFLFVRLCARAERWQGVIIKYHHTRDESHPRQRHREQNHPAAGGGGRSYGVAGCGVRHDDLGSRFFVSEVLLVVFTSLSGFGLKIKRIFVSAFITKGLSSLS